MEKKFNENQELCESIDEKELNEVNQYFDECKKNNFKNFNLTIEDILEELKNYEQQLSI